MKFIFPQTVLFTLILPSLLCSRIGFIDNNNIAVAGTLSQNTQTSSNKLPKAIADKVLQDAAKRSGVAIAKLKITQAKPKTFGNKCLFNFGEICTKEYKPIKGWEVIVQVKQQLWTYHSNQSGSQIVLDPKIVRELQNGQQLKVDKCLPKNIKLTDIVSAKLVSATPVNSPKVEQVTVKQELQKLKANCNKQGKLVDNSGKEIYFYKLTGCWGNPPFNYQEILQKQSEEIKKLQQSYRVIEMTCNPSGIPIP